MVSHLPNVIYQIDISTIFIPDQGEIHHKILLPLKNDSANNQLTIWMYSHHSTFYQIIPSVHHTFPKYFYYKFQDTCQKGFWSIKEFQEPDDSKSESTEIKFLIIEQQVTWQTYSYCFSHEPILLDSVLKIHC